MNVAIIAAGTAPLYYEQLDKRLNSLIEKSGCYLFTILCGRLADQERRGISLGQQWAVANGCPVRYITAKTEKQLIDKMINLTDYAIFILDGNSQINNIFMRYKMEGKHGTVIKL